MRKQPHSLTARAVAAAVTLPVLAAAATGGALAPAYADPGSHPPGGAAARADAFVPPVHVQAGSVVSVGKLKHHHRRVVLSPQAPRVHRGDVVTAGVGRRTPSGLLVQVTKVTPRPGGGQVLATVPAALGQALPPGDYTASQDFGHPADSLADLGPAAGIGTPSAGSPFSLLPSCTKDSKVSASVSGGVNLQGSLEASLHLAGLVPDRAHFRLRVDEDAWLKLALAAKASCSGGGEILRQPLNLTIAGLVVPVTLVISLDATLTADGSLAVGGHQHASLDVGFDYRDGTIKPTAPHVPTPTLQLDKPQLQGKASAEVGITASLTAGILDAFTGRLNVRGAIGASVDSTADPRWEVYGAARAWADLVLWVPVWHTVLWKSDGLDLVRPQRWTFAQAVSLRGPSTLPAGVVGQQYPPVQLTAKDGWGATSVQAVQSSLPPGLTVSPTGLVTGVPLPIGAASTTFHPVLSVRDEVDSTTVVADLTVTTLPPPVISTVHVNGGEVGSALTAQLEGTSPNGGPLHWAFVDGTAHHGYTLSDAGVLETDSVGLDDVLQVQVTDAAGQTARATVTVDAVEPPEDPPGICDRMPWKCPTTP